MAMKKCAKCGKEIPEEKGVKLLRGITFVCKDCYHKEHEKNKDKEVCEFC